MADQAEDGLDSFQGESDPVQSPGLSNDPVAAPAGGGGLSNLGNIQSYDTHQMPISDTTRKYTPGAAIAMENSNAYYAKQFTQQKQEAVRKIAGAIQEGDYKKAAAIYSQIDPQGFQKILPHLEAIDPSLARGLSYGKKKGELTAEKESGQLPTDVAAAKAEGKPQTDAQKVEDPDGVVRLYNRNKMTGALTPTGQTAGFATKIKTNKNTGGYEAVSGSGRVSKPVSLSGNVVEEDSQGNKVTLQPGQQEKLNKEVDTFNKDETTKDLSKQMHAYEVAHSMVEKNPSAGMPLEILRMIRTVTTRPTQQEFMAMKGWSGQGIQTGIGNAISEAKNGKMSPQTQKNLLNILDTVAEANVNEYNQHLQSKVAQIQGKTKIGDQTLDPKIIENRLNAVAPSSIQEAYKQADKALGEIKNLPPGEARANYFKQLSPQVQRLVRARVKGNK
jgi:hypothetical protein